MINMLLVQISNRPDKFVRDMFIWDPALGPTIDISSALKTLDPGVQKYIISCICFDIFDQYVIRTNQQSPL